MSMKRQVRMIVAAASLAAVGLSAVAGATVFDGSGSVGATSSSTSVTTSPIDAGTTQSSLDRSLPSTTATTSDADVSGPCDEAEHANDPRCAGVAGNGTSTTLMPSTTPTSSGVDISGPCDEAEHANDPRCNGGQSIDNSEADGQDSRHRSGDDDNDDEDRSGRSDSDDDDDDDNDDEDRSGRSDSDDDDDDHSGRGGSDDGRDDDDHSGRGRNGESDD